MISVYDGAYDVSYDVISYDGVSLDRYLFFCAFL